MSEPWDWTPEELAYLASPERAARLRQPDGYADEAPELPYGWDFDPAELEDFHVSEADRQWWAIHRLGVALRDMSPESILEAILPLDGDRLVVLEAVIQHAIGLRADAMNERYATT